MGKETGEGRKGMRWGKIKGKKKIKRLVASNQQGLFQLPSTSKFPERAKTNDSFDDNSQDYDAP